MNIARRQHCCTEDGSKCWSSSIYNSGSVNSFYPRSRVSMGIAFDRINTGITFQSQSGFYFSAYCWRYRISLCRYESFLT